MTYAGHRAMRGLHRRAITLIDRCGRSMAKRWPRITVAVRWRRCGIRRTESAYRQLGAKGGQPLRQRPMRGDGTGFRDLPKWEEGRTKSGTVRHSSMVLVTVSWLQLLLCRSGACAPGRIELIGPSCAMQQRALQRGGRRPCRPLHRYPLEMRRMPALQGCRRSQQRGQGSSNGSAQQRP